MWSHLLKATPRCLLRADSGMPHDLTPRSDSEISGSPPDHSETSSWVHSNSSRESHHTGIDSFVTCFDCCYYIITNLNLFDIYNHFTGNP